MRKSIENSQPKQTDPVATSTPTITILVGIDWADKEHAYSALLPSGKIKTGSFKQNKTGIEEWIAELAKGKSAQIAKRALAFKWIRIIFPLWQARVGYDDSHYVSRLNKTGSPLAKQLQIAAT